MVLQTLFEIQKGIPIICINFVRIHQTGITMYIFRCIHIINCRIKYEFMWTGGLQDDQKSKPENEEAMGYRLITANK
jgi:hypothetical protein